MSENFKILHKDAHKKTLEIDCLPLTPLIKPRFPKINFLSLDVEGYELPFLESLDFTELQIDVIVTEKSDNTTKNAILIEFIEEKGYSCITSVIPRSYLFIHHSVKYCYSKVKSKTLDDLLKNF